MILEYCIGVRTEATYYTKSVLTEAYHSLSGWTYAIFHSFHVQSLNNPDPMYTTGEESEFSNEIEAGDDQERRHPYITTVIQIHAGDSNNNDINHDHFLLLYHTVVYLRRI